MKKSLLITLLISFKCISQNINFEAKGILYLSDSDFNSFSYSTDLIEKDKNSTDKIGSFQFPLTYEDSYNNSEKVVSNSALKCHKQMVLSSNNRTCYVLETLGSQKKNDANKSFRIKDLAEGSYVSVVDVSNLRGLKADYKFQVGLNPHCIALNKTNEYLAVGAEGYNQELQVFELDGLGKPIRLLQKPSLIGNGVVSDVVWHPTLDYIAFIKSESKEVGLLRIIRDNSTQKIIRIELAGNTIKMEGVPITGLFSKDGKYFYVIDKKNQINQNYSQDKGLLFSIKFNYEDPLAHALLSKIELDVNPVSMLIHPDGQSLVVNNIKRSFEYPYNDRNTGKSSLSLVQLLPDGNIINKANISLDGIMCLGMGFDKTGKNLAVSSFQSMTYGKASGEINFYKYISGVNIQIEKQVYKVHTNKGIHSIKIIEDF